MSQAGTGQDEQKKLWMAGPDVLASLKSLIAQFHPHLAMCDDEIAVLFKEKATSSGDVVVSGKTTKASPQVQVLGEKDWKFTITLGADVWQSYTDKQRIALLDHHLCGCRIEEKEGGVLRYYYSPPPVAFYPGELERHGLWRTTGSPVEPNLIAELFEGD